MRLADLQERLMVSQADITDDDPNHVFTVAQLVEFLKIKGITKVVDRESHVSDLAQAPIIAQNMQKRIVGSSVRNVVDELRKVAITAVDIDKIATVINSAGSSIKN